MPDELQVATGAMSPKQDKADNACIHGNQRGSIVLLDTTTGAVFLSEAQAAKRMRVSRLTVLALMGAGVLVKIVTLH